MISEHISEKESVYSRTAIRRDIDNTPTEEHRNNMCIIAENIFEPLRSWVGGPIKINTNAEMYEFIKEHLEFDQMIWEFGDDDNPDWVHVSYKKDGINRNRCLKAYKDKGKSKYMVI